MKTLKYGETQRVQLLFIAIFAIILPLIFGLIWAHQFVAAKSPSANILISSYIGMVQPKPTEQFVFVLLAAIVPVLSILFSMTSWESWEHGVVKVSSIPAMILKYLPFALAGALLAPLVGADFVEIAIGDSDRTNLPGLFAISVAYIIASGCCMWFVSQRHIPMRNMWAASPHKTAWIFFLSVVVLDVLAWRVVSIASVTYAHAWSIHADALIYPISQVVAGKTLMVDLPSQYGLFPEMLAPLFKLTGFSLLNLSVVFAIMQVTSLAALYYVLSRLLKNKLLLIVAGFALMTFTFETMSYYAGENEFYFQYWPTRFFWPAASVFFFYFFARKKTLTRGCFVSLIGAIGLLWNVDSGLFISVAYGAYLCARLIVLLMTARQKIVATPLDQWSASRYFNAIVLHVLVTAIVISLFLMALAWKSHKSLDLFWLLQYQYIFYDLGLMMLPLPLVPAPWMSVLAIYLMGLLCSLEAWRRRPSKVTNDIVFYLSILGLGLFIYYEGRSNITNLFKVYWPALLISTILADRILRSIRARLLPFTQIYFPIAAVALLLLASASIISRIPRLSLDASRQFATRGVFEEPVIGSEIAFIKQYAVGKRECLILSNRQGIYYAESGLASPIKGPGLIEMLLKTDQDFLVNQIMSGDVECIFRGIAVDSDVGLKLDEEKMRDRYKIVATNLENSMQYLELKRDLTQAQGIH